MDSSTLNLYLAAGGVSISLCLVLLVFGYLQPGSRMLNALALGIFLFSLGFSVSGLGHLLPRWATVMGTNMVFLLAASVVHAGLVSFCKQHPLRPDWLGWAVVALTALPFGYWGLIEPDGHLRSAVFSLALVVINGRTAWLLLRTARAEPSRAPFWTLAALFGLFTLWMASRGLLSVLADAPTPALRGANPTTWTTVFGYIVMVSLITVGVIWLESSQFDNHSPTQSSRTTHGLVGFFYHRLRLLWTLVLIVLLAIAGEAGVIYAKSFEAEKTRLTRVTELAANTFARHSAQVVNQVDTLLKAVRGFYQQTQSLPATEAFINSLPFDKSTVDNIYLISAQADVLITHDPAPQGRKTSQRDYFLFHQTNPADQLFISPVESGVVTGKYHFRITRRINQPDGSFGGVVLATVVPESFERYYSDLNTGGENSAALVSTQDRKLRARVPAPPVQSWHVPLETPLWERIKQSQAGTYSTTSSVDEVDRIYAYQQVAHLPLVMVTGFSVADVQSSVFVNLRWLLLGSATAAAVVLLMATLLTLEIRRRDEQDQFLSMLSHELKTPLAVIRMSLGAGAQTIDAASRARLIRAVADINAIVERCLQTDRLEHGRIEIVPATCQPGELLRQIVDACSAPERVCVEISALPDCITDAQLLSVVLANLIDNALKYSATDTPVAITAKPEVRHGQDGLIFVVANQAGTAGMPDANQVFRRYYRAPGAHGKTGSGLGLHIAEGFARLLGGALFYRPQANTIKFELWIPN